MLLLVLSQAVWAMPLDTSYYYDIHAYVAYERHACPTLTAACDTHESTVVYGDVQTNNAFIALPSEKNNLSNTPLGGGCFVLSFVVMQCMDWWIKRNARIQHFIATYKTWTCQDYQRLFEGEQWCLPDEKVFTLYHHYQFRGFRDYLKTRKQYEEEIITLAAALECKDKKLRKAINHMPGCSKAQFRQLISEMITDIRHAQASREKKEALRIWHAMIDHMASILNSELSDILLEPRTMRVLAKAVEYMMQVPTTLREEKSDQLISLDECSTTTVI